jgi:hypothetical protein
VGAADRYPHGGVIAGGCCASPPRSPAVP